jgi:hypothetical protein
MLLWWNEAKVLLVLRRQLHHVELWAARAQAVLQTPHCPTPHWIEYLAIQAWT